MPHFFAKKVLDWHIQNPRKLPWEDGPRDPYHIWISEVIMQQTRIEQGGPYYQRFVTRFPSVFSLASASLNEVLQSWQGLGYYTRARNLFKTAQFVVDQYAGEFPSTYEQLLSLPGIGPYSASAIASFAFHQPYPVVDGNVKRVISRFEGIQEPVSLPRIHERIRLHAVDYMKGADPAIFNQAIMNFGALVCKPQNPSCQACPLKSRCIAYHSGLTNDIPVTLKKKPNTDRHFHFLVLHYRNKILLHQRDQNDIWHSLYAAPILETKNQRKPSRTKLNVVLEELLGHEDFIFIKSSGSVRQLLSHQTIHGRFHHFQAIASPKRNAPNFLWVTKKNLADYGKPKMIADYLRSTVSS